MTDDDYYMEDTDGYVRDMPRRGMQSAQCIQLCVTVQCWLDLCGITVVLQLALLLVPCCAAVRASADASAVL